MCYQDEILMKFSIRNVAKDMGKESNDVYMELSGLQYNDLGIDGRGTSNTISVEFSSKVFHIRSAVCFSSSSSSKNQVDKVCEFLGKKVRKQEESLVEKLHLLRGILQSVNFNVTGSEIIMIDKAVKIQGSLLRESIQRCFNDEQFSASCLGIDSPLLPVYQQVSSELEEQIEADVHLFLLINNPLIQFTGRAIARIFYGLGSPLFPARDWAWGRCRQFWRKYIEVNFDQLCQIATKKVEEFHQN
jgi:ATP-dependent DNA helicase Q4